MTSMGSYSGQLKWAWRSSCPGIEILLRVTAVRITGSVGCAIRTATSWWLPVPTDRPVKHGVPANRQYYASANSYFFRVSHVEYFARTQRKLQALAAAHVV